MSARRLLPIALSAAACAAWALAGARPAAAQVSPGPMSAAHASLDGATQCFRCHASGGAKAGMDARCLACHGEIAWMRDRHRGFHAAVAAKPCAGCHPDHGGRAFALVVWDAGSPAKFDHRRAGWALQGRHAALECRACHKPALQKSGAAPLLRKQDHAASWLGLETACAQCHADPHRGQLGAECGKCHGLAGWKPASGFDHARTAYPLTGAHAQVECARCHASAKTAAGRDGAGRPVPTWKPLAHDDCAACHADPHAGRFPGACARCHQTSSWKQAARGTFDHDATRYALRGRHVTVACAACHDPKKAWGARPRFAACGDCHHDAHAGTATRLGRPADCAACHTVDGFAIPAFTIDAHAGARYPLAGRHVAVPCAKCHAVLPDTPASRAAWGPARVVMRPAFDACVACHADPHAGRFESGGERARPERCLACHDMDGFRPSRYDAALHATATFPLAGAHRAATCADCHDELRAAAAADTSHARTLRLAVSNRDCEGCHRDPHAGQFAHRADHGACAGCHDESAFAPASRFDHARDAGWPLDDGHRRVACAACHDTARDESGTAQVRYRPVARECEGCHDTGTAPPSKGGR